MNLPAAVHDRADEMTDDEIFAACLAEDMAEDEARFVLRTVRKRAGITPR